MVFKVRACNDAHVQLSEYIDLNAQLTYVVVIGGGYNTRSFIRRYKGGPNEALVDTPRILDCDKLRTFWVSWSDGVIEAGQGPLVGDQKFIGWTDPEPREVKAVNVATGWGAAAEWRLWVAPGGSFLLRY